MAKALPAPDDVAQEQGRAHKAVPRIFHMSGEFENERESDVGIECGKDPEDTPDVEPFDVDGPHCLPLPAQQIGDEETAEGEKERHREIPQVFRDETVARQIGVTRQKEENADPAKALELGIENG